MAKQTSKRIRSAEEEDIVRRLCQRDDSDRYTVEELALVLRKTEDWVRDHAAKRRRPYLPCEKPDGVKGYTFPVGEIKKFLAGLLQNAA